MLSAESTLNAIDEAKAVFRSAVDELCARAAALHVSLADRGIARALADDLLSDLFWSIEQETKAEIGEE